MTLSEYLLHFIGTPYVWAGDGTGTGGSGFDCSGLVLEGLWAMGLYKGGDLTAEGINKRLLNDGWKSPLKPKADDILFFGKSKITHVAVAIDERLMVEAGGGGSKCTSASKSTGFVRIRPIASRNDLCDILRMQ